MGYDVPTASRALSVNEWAPWELSEWLAGQGFADEGVIFTEQWVTGSDIAGVTDADLVRMGVADPARRSRLL